MSFSWLSQGSQMQLSDPQFLIDRNHRIVSWNAAMEELTGITSGSVIGTVLEREVFYGIPCPCLAVSLVDERRDPSGRDRCIYNDQELPREVLETTIFFPCPGQSGTWLHFTASVIRFPSGPVIGAVETIVDITDQKRVERDLTLSRRKLRLMNDIAWHEIQNKITGIRGYVEALKGDNTRASWRKMHRSRRAGTP